MHVLVGLWRVYYLLFSRWTDLVGWGLV
jgi:hypothetical protein